MEEFRAIISSLKPFEQKRVVEFIDALRSPCNQSINADSEIVDDRFADEFRSRLLVQHAYVGTPLFQDAFESAFVGAALASGQSCARAPDGARFWDVELEGAKISLKSTKARNLRPERLWISKLTEAAWIQDCRNAAKREQETKGLFREYLALVSSIFQLRYFSNRNFYELVEIPCVLFAPVFGVPRTYFDSDGPSVGIPIGMDPPILTIKLDRSDAKITITNIQKVHCTVHATWQL